MKKYPHGVVILGLGVALAFAGAQSDDWLALRWAGALLVGLGAATFLRR